MAHIFIVFWGMIDSRFTHIILVLWGFNHGFMCGAVLVASDGSSQDVQKPRCAAWSIVLPGHLISRCAKPSLPPAVWAAAPLWASGLWKAISIVSASHDNAWQKRCLDVSAA